MSLTIWILFIIVGVICTFVIKKTICSYNNDYRIKDILSANFVKDNGAENFSKKTDFSSTHKSIYEENKKNENTCTDDEKSNSEEINRHENLSKKSEPEIEHKYLYRPPKSIFDYLKMFWHGITFIIGVFVCIYSLIGILYYIQTTNDAIIYSIWLLIGVILIK
ncbi:MAG: hypothetical protein LUB59_07390 [Candidatus Gastranaerophilales bacterium]|nr:hypothetical protein [Candidatus Gastranaerophilales bacterium]